MAIICPFKEGEDKLSCQECRFRRIEEDVNSHWFGEYVCWLQRTFDRIRKLQEEDKNKGEK